MNTNKTKMSEEEWENKLQHGLWKVINDIDDERETEASIKLSNEDVVKILQDIINSLKPKQR